jgi:uncharacterized protein with gpF-like domain
MNKLLQTVVALFASLAAKQTKKRQPPKSRKENKKNILNDLRWSPASRALFTGLENKTDVLGEIQKRIIQVVEGNMSSQQARWWIREFLFTEGKDVLRELGFAFEEYEMNENDNLFELGSSSRLKLIIEQNVRNIQAAKEYDGIIDSKRVYPYVEYCVWGGEQTCSHHKLNGNVYEVGTPAMRAVSPPNDLHCNCYWRQLMASELNGRKVERKAPPPEELSQTGFTFDPNERPLLLKLYPIVL